MTGPIRRHQALQGIHVLERGWLSSNNILIGEAAGCALVDSGYVSRAAQTRALVGQALDGRRLTRLINTHLHSDHCGGNATLQRAFGCELWIPPGQWTDVMAWNTDALGYAPTGQDCERFVPDRALLPGATVDLADRSWSVLAAPGHDPHSVVLFDAQEGVLISADALWENGFGIVFPELDGTAGFADVAAVLDLIGSLPVSIVIPGHGRPFADVKTALERARRRLDSFVADPAKHAYHAAKVLVKFHLLDVRWQSQDDLLGWATRLPYLRMLLGRYFDEANPKTQFAALVDDLCDKGVLRRSGELIQNM
jgi:glyoxylase-like metal-dependent hydrolase (beta-lactamase superfamily II)